MRALTDMILPMHTMTTTLTVATALAPQSKRSAPGCALAIATAALLLPALPAFAQAWPVKPVRWIAPYPPGGSSDLVARAIGNRLAELLGQPVLIDNRPGVGGSLGTELAARAAPDGYTMLLANIAPLAINPHIYPKLGYDVMRDFEAVSLLATGPTLLVVGPSLPVKNLQELIALAKAKPGAIKYGTGGSGTPAHLTTELLRLMTGVELLHVPYKGTGQSVTDLLGGQIDFVFASPPVAAAHVKSGTLRAPARRRQWCCTRRLHPCCCTSRRRSSLGLPPLAAACASRRCRKRTLHDAEHSPHSSQSRILHATAQSFASSSAGHARPSDDGRATMKRVRSLRPVAAAHSDQPLHSPTAQSTCNTLAMRSARTV